MSDSLLDRLRSLDPSVDPDRLVVLDADDASARRQLRAVLDRVAASEAGHPARASDAPIRPMEGRDVDPVRTAPTDTDAPTTAADPTRGRSRRGLALAAAAAVAIAATGAVLLDRLTASVPDDTPDPVTPIVDSEAPAPAPAPAPEETIPARDPDVEMDLDERIAAVGDMFAAFNRGDWDAWRAFFTDRPHVLGTVVASEQDLDFMRSRMAAGEQWAVVGECSQDRLGLILTCETTARDEFLGAADIEYTEVQMTFAFTGELFNTLRPKEWRVNGVPETFYEDFDTWLAEAHPDVHASFAPRLDIQGARWMPRAEDMPIALTLVDEFVAQSEDYPKPPLPER